MYFSRKRSRVAAQGSDSASEGAPNSPCRSPSSATKSSFPVRRKLHLHFVRLRISALLRLLKHMSLSFRHALLAFTTWKKRSLPRKPAGVGLAFSGQCTRSACAPDAIADCIEFIKRSASASSSSNFLPLSSPSSFSSSSSSSSPLSSPRQPASNLRHDSSPPASPRHHLRHGLSQSYQR